MMFLWYKKKVLFRSKTKIAGLIIMPILYFVLYSIFKVNIRTSMFFLGISVPLLYTYVLFTVGDITRVNCYIAAGEQPKRMWFANMFFVTLTGLIMSLISQGIAALVFGKTLNECLEFFVITLCEAPLVALSIGLSTLHFRNHSRIEVVVASIFAVLNALLFFLPMSDLIMNLALDRKIAYIMGIVGFIGTFILNIYMNFSDNETLIMNAAKQVSSYDKALLGLDGE